MIQVRVWDWPTRIFHWALASLVVALVITGNVGGNAMVWHFRCGYGVLSLLLFRLLWGFLGGHWSRWRQLTCTPSALRQYIAGSQSRFLGHNPLGSLSIIAMLALLLLQASTGLLSDDEIANAGPLTVWVSESVVNITTYWHKEIGKALVLLLVATHLLAIGWHFFKKQENLTRAMLLGDKASDVSAPSSQEGVGQWLKALSCLCISSGLVYLLISAVPSP
ncbi:MAG: putative Ni/Fe-hydrogenase B-type cytochrome subunit [Pseudomonadota bacterium]|jgi:cytochrome b